MYKSLLKNIKELKKAEKQFIEDLHKNIGKKPHAIHDKMPHFIFSVEQPRYDSKINMSHDEMVGFLKDKGYQVDSIKGHYGEPEKSIMIHNPPKSSLKYFHDLAHKLGQESSIYSDGTSHEMHFHHGDYAGQHIKGQGTNISENKPEDFYSELPSGGYFTHQFDWDSKYPNESSMLKIKPKNINKSEKEDSNRIFIRKNENDHPLSNAKPSVKLIHYSPTQSLSELDPQYHGIRAVGAEAKQGKPVHPMSYYYLENTKPEKVVMTGTKSKYITSLGDKKLYDIGKDPDGLYQRVKEEANKRRTNPGIVRKEDYHNAIRNAGYHGIYNSSLNDTMRNVVGMFEKMPVEKEYPIHPRDFHVARNVNHHRHKERYDSARQHADETGHHSHKFLAKLSAKFNKDNE